MIDYTALAAASMSLIGTLVGTFGGILAVSYTHLDVYKRQGQLQLVFIPDRHKTHQNMGHPEIAQAPGHHGYDTEQAVRLGLTGGLVIGLAKAQEAGQCLGMVYNLSLIHISCLFWTSSPTVTGSPTTPRDIPPLWSPKA